MRKLFFTLVASIAATAPVYAEVFELPPDGYDVIGSVATIKARYEDTLVDIARRLRSAGLNAPRVFHFDHDLGFGLLEDFGDVTRFSTEDEVREIVSLWQGWWEKR